MNITQYTLNSLCRKGLQVDLFGQVLQVGDIVITNQYGNANMSVLATVLKVNKKSVVLSLNYKSSVGEKESLQRSLLFVE